MSTKLIAFKANNDQHLQNQIGAMKLLISQDPMLVEVGAIHGIEVQVFRTSKGIVYRVLELGYGLRNKMWKFPNLFPNCSFDGRSQSEEDFPFEVAVAEEIDNLIATKQYSVEIIMEAL